MKWIKILGGSVVLTMLATTLTLSAQCTFTNPVMEGADPHVTYHDGYYYMLVTRGDRVSIKRSAELHKIHEYNEIVVWRFENTQVGGHIWAPELHRVDGKWYIYTCGQNTGMSINPEAVPYIQENQQMFVLESLSDDPLGPYEFKSWIMKGTGAIDETIFTHTDGKQYMVWSQFNEPGQPQTQCLYIGELLDPWTVATTRVRISCPDQSWELNGWPVNEGAAVLERNGKTYIVYSGSGYTTPEYALGYLVNTDGDLLNPASWTKKGPIFSQNPAGGVYSTGHNSFTTSPDGSEDWIVYHGRLSSNGYTSRYVFLQKFLWKGDEPYLGIPLPVGEELACPSKGKGQVVSMQSQAYPGTVVFANPATGQAAPWTIEPDSAAFFNRYARFLITPGLAGVDGISLESLEYRGHYLRDLFGEIVIQPYDDSPLFGSDATFFFRDPLAGPGQQWISLESFTETSWFLRQMGSSLLIRPVTPDSLLSVREEATWSLLASSEIFDCNGDYLGSAFIDSCGICAGGNTGVEPSLDKYDCTQVYVRETQGGGVSIYPNPAKDFLYFELPFQTSGTNIMVMDMTGRTWAQREGENNRISLKDFDEGIYVISFLSDRNYFSSTFVKIR